MRRKCDSAFVVAVDLIAEPGFCKCFLDDFVEVGERQLSKDCADPAEQAVCRLIQIIALGVRVRSQQIVQQHCRGALLPQFNQTQGGVNRSELLEESVIEGGQRLRLDLAAHLPVAERDLEQLAEKATGVAWSSLCDWF